MHTALPLSIDAAHTGAFLHMAQQSRPVSMAVPPGHANMTLEEYALHLSEQKFGLMINPQTGLAIQPVSGFIYPGCDAIDEAFFQCFNSMRLFDTCNVVASNPAIRALVLHISSPGGLSMLNRQVADAIVDLKNRRPDVAVLSFIEGLGCSAAMCIAAAADEVHAMAGSIVGSISTKYVLVDSSRAFENAGLRVIDLSTGKHKATGTPGLPITPEQEAEERRLTESLGRQFKDFMAARREGLTDDDMQGQAWLAIPGEYPEPLLDSAQWRSPSEFYEAVVQELSLSAQ